MYKEALRRFGTGITSVILLQWVLVTVLAVFCIIFIHMVICYGYLYTDLP